MVRLDAQASPLLRATIYALKSIDRTLQKQVRQYTKAIAEPEWKQALASRAKTRLESRVIVDTAVVSVSNQNVRVQSAGKGKTLRGGLNPKVDYPAVEFGAVRKRATYTRRSVRGRSHQVTRTVNTGLPPRRKEGPFWRSARNMVPRIASLWVQTAVKTIGNALEGKQE